MNAPPSLLEIEDLRIAFEDRRGLLEAVQGVSLEIARGGVLGIVGESGSGKTVTMLAVLGLLPRSARVSGSVRFHGRELLGLPAHELRQIRGARVGMIFQDPLSALNPVLTVGEQIAEAIRLHDREVSRKAAFARAVELLDLVSIPRPAQRARQYPHEFSGGMRQRVMIAIAVANEPELLIADEPTTALDVTVQAQILEVLHQLGEALGVALVLITHDLGVIAGTANDVAVMYAGKIVERGAVEEVFYRSRHPYTQGLLASLPKLELDAEERLYSIQGSPPSLTARPSGCAFHPRCERALARCRVEEPALRPLDAVRVACHVAHSINGTAAEEAGDGPPD